jgi:Holliday junction DNA helicase RuvB
MTTTETPLSQQLAAEWVAVDPDFHFTCYQCKKDVVPGAMPVPSMICPFCGFTPSDNVCRSGLMGLADRRQRMAEKVAQAVETVEAPAEAPRCDPPGLVDVIGNKNAVAQIEVYLNAHKAWLKDFPKQPFPHILISGASGLGKSMLANIMARELERRYIHQIGQALNNPRKVGELLLSLKDGDVLFIDELHGISKPCQEALYLAMEDGVVIPVTKAGASVSKPIKLPPFTLIGGTTDIWGLHEPLLQRFKYHVKLKRLTPGELADAMMQRAKRKGWELNAEAAAVIGARAHGTPRLAIKLFDGCMAVAKAGGENKVDAFIVHRTCEILEIDALGLDDEARRYLNYLAEASGPVRVNVLASKLDGLSRLTVERRLEPDLVYLGLILKGEKGRILTAAGRDHLAKAH